MKKILTAALLLASLAGATAAHAQVVSGGIVVSNGYRGQPHYSGGVYVQQPPVYYRPAPVYYYPRPVMAPPPPVYYVPSRHHHRKWDRYGYYPYYGHHHRHRHDDDD
jgi:hypothetical protein